MRLAGRSAVVTGAAHGIGYAIAEAFLREGANVVLGDIDAAAAEQAAKSLDPTAGRSLAIECDVTSEPDVAALVAACVDRFGAIDVMVNNAGITRDATMAKMPLADFRAVLDVHLQGSWLGTKAAAAAMVAASQGGAIVNVSSISGKAGIFGQTNYSAAKAGIVGLTKAAAREVARKGIRVNAIQPGLIRTAMTEAMPQAAWDAKMADIPLGRAGEPAEVANVVVFLASDMSSYLTGAVIEVTGGRHM
jgi:3-oxoacyl-[acyl-carrier protein] reductase